MLNMIVGALLITAGYFLCYFTRQTKKTTYTDIVTEVKRVKPNLKSPLTTYSVAYEKFKARDSGLYEPTTPKRGE